MQVRAVFFDVDFTLIYPGPMFGGQGYHTFCSRYGIQVDPAAFSQAVVSAATLLDSIADPRHDDEVFVAFTRHIIEQMGGRGDQVDACAREIYREWGSCQHFELYEDAPAVLRELAGRGLRIGLISNSHRCLVSFQSHFELQGLIAGTISSAEHGYMKPHPSIFEAALRGAAVTAAESVMVGDSLTHDVDGARRLGMRGVLVSRSGPVVAPPDVPVIQSLRELPSLL